MSSSDDNLGLNLSPVLCDTFVLQSVREPALLGLAASDHLHHVITNISCKIPLPEQQLYKIPSLISRLEILTAIVVNISVL
jgi:hypothetical protein